MKKSIMVVTGGFVFAVLICVVGFCNSESHKAEVSKLSFLNEDLRADAHFKYIHVQSEGGFEKSTRLFGRFYWFGRVSYYKISGVVKTESDKEQLLRYVRQELKKKVVERIDVAGEEKWPAIVEEAKTYGL